MRSPTREGPTPIGTSPGAELLDLTRNLSGHLEMESLLDAVVRGAMDLIPCDGGFAAAVDDGELRSFRYVRPRHSIPFARAWGGRIGLPNWVRRTGNPCLTNRAQGDERLDRSVRERFAIRSALAVPIRNNRDEVRGVIVLHNRTGASADPETAGFSRADLLLLEEIARSASAPLANVEAFREQGPSAAVESTHHSQRLQAVGQFTAGIAHDFNNFLTVVLGETDLLLQDPDEAGHRAELGDIRDAALRARFLTRRLLAFSRKEGLEPGTVEVARTLGELVRLLRRLVGANIEIRTDLAEDLPSVSLAPGQLDQIVMNLALNARDAMPGGGTLTLRAQPALRGGVRVEVIDDGVGMDEETRARVFDPYFTTKGAGEGTGLGLATVSDIVRGAGGSVDVTSAPGAGTTFGIHLPASGAPRHAAEPGEDGRGAASRAAGTTILLVEDEDAVRRLVRRVLERQGYTVLAAATGASAVELAQDRARTIDLLVTDVMLPDMGGIQLWQLLSARISSRRTILMSGYLEDDLPQFDLDSGEVEFLPKPFAIRDLLRLVEGVLGPD